MLEQLAQTSSNQFELLPIVQAANLDNLDELLGKKPHIFHFIGHSQFNNNNPEIALTIPEVPAMHDWKPANSFAGLFQRHRPGVVLLQSCEGGMLSSQQAFVGLASEIAEQRVSAVVAMQYEIQNHIAVLFAQTFYQKLALGERVDSAVQESRLKIQQRIGNTNTLDFATPLILVHPRAVLSFNTIQPNPQLPAKPDDEPKQGSNSVATELDFSRLPATLPKLEFKERTALTDLLLKTTTLRSDQQRERLLQEVQDGNFVTNLNRSNQARTEILAIVEALSSRIGSLPAFLEVLHAMENNTTEFKLVLAKIEQLTNIRLS